MNKRLKKHYKSSDIDRAIWDRFKYPAMTDNEICARNNISRGAFKYHYHKRRRQFNGTFPLLTERTTRYYPWFRIFCYIFQRKEKIERKKVKL